MVQNVRQCKENKSMDFILEKFIVSFFVQYVMRQKLKSRNNVEFKKIDFRLIAEVYFCAIVIY